MITIHKQTLDLMLNQILMPKGAQVLHVHEQFNRPCIWYLCDDGELQEGRTFLVVGTGYPAPSASEAKYIGTVHISQGTLVWHIFEKI